MSRLTEFQALAKADPEAAEEVLRQLREAAFVPHNGGQLDVMRSTARFRILRAGRRWGKTKLAAHEAVNAGLKPDQMIWWVSNSDKNVRRGYREVQRQLPKGMLAKPAPSENANDRILHLVNGTKIEFYTAGSAAGATADSSALTGEGVDFLVVDEAALMQQSVWFQYLRPTLSDTGGRALVISTPRGRNWFYQLCQRGEQGGAYESWAFPTVSNPYIEDSEVEDARDTLPDIVFRQEYLAEFVANAASMFVVPNDGIEHGLSEPAGQIMLGIDLAKKEDFTVITGARLEDRMPCYHERMKDVSWPVQEEAIVAAIRELESYSAVDGVTAVIDSTGIGDVVFDHLDEHGLDIVPVNFAGGWKERAVRLLAADLENGDARILDWQLSEFESYEYSITAGGRYKFEAATGHDDEVSAKLLENWGIHNAAAPVVRIMGSDEPEEDWDTTARGVDNTPLIERDEVWEPIEGWRDRREGRF